ncbi:MAG: hypothetical protein SF053_08635 [Bacteroidia bacterium]|nr:hypothetical protein [Bacteroidia bacterium]
MYDFIFAFFCQYNRRSGSATPETSAVIAVVCVQVLHLGLLFGVCKRVFSLSLTPLADKGAYTIMALLIVAPLLVLNFFYYHKNKRASILLKHQDTNLLVAREIVKVMGVFLIPIVLMAIMDTRA